MYLALANTLVADIQAGRYEVGAQLPTEAELMKQFGMSRHTVREAVRELQQQGFVATLHGIGTLVRAREGPLRFVQRASSFEDLVEFSQATRMQLLAQRPLVAGEADTALLQCAPGEPWLEIEVLRTGPESPQPIGFISTYLRPEFADVVPLIETSRRPIFALVEQAHGLRIAEMDQEIVSVTVPERTAALLNAPAGGHGLKITRRYRNEQGRITQVSVGIYPEGRLVHSSMIQVQRAA